MPIEWTTLAQHDLRVIHAHIAQDDREAAVRVVRTIYTGARAQLTTYPLSGREGRVTGTRELIISRLPYIVAYRIHKDVIQVLRILHTSLRWPHAL